MAESFRVEAVDARRRLDVVVAERFSRLSRSRVQSLVESGHIKLNGETVKPRYSVRAGDLVTIEEPPVVAIDLRPEAIPITFLFQDEFLAVINKPAGLVVHPGAGQIEGTLVNALLHHCTGLSGIGGELRPGIVHRLDKETSGCLVIAKNDEIHHRLSRQFANRVVEKIYLAVCSGLFREKSGDIREPIGRNPFHRKKMAVTTKGRDSHTQFEVVKEVNDNTVVLCRLLTGRTHQIRVHLQHLKHPVLGDILYGRRASASRLMLHAWRLGFQHPMTQNWMEFRAEVPQEFFKFGVDPDELVHTRLGHSTATASKP
ncbi:MAG: RluA family pseudouridine synthase [Verrucomicrobia bacterium]|nr:RluA family pseudouridine synthase [Verrucomicrobiota bacterium]